MIEAILPVLSSMPTGINAQPASAENTVDVASGPLSQATGVDIQQFNDVVDQIDVVPHSTASAKWSTLEKKASGVMTNMMSQEVRVNNYANDELSSWYGDDGFGITPASFNPGNIALTGDGNSGAQSMMEKFDEQVQESFHEAVDMIDFRTKLDLMSKVADGVGTGVRHLSNGGS